MEADETAGAGYTRRSLRIAILIPAVWFFLLVITRDLLAGVLWTPNVITSVCLDIAGMALLTAVFLYLLRPIKEYRDVTWLVLPGIVLLLFSQLGNTGNYTGLLEKTLSGNIHIFLARSAGLAADLGLLLMAGGFMLALVDLLAATQRFQREHAKAVEAMKAVAERDRAMEALSEAALDAIILMNQDGAVAYWNPAAEKMFGYGQAEVLGKPLHELLAPPEYRPLFAAALPEWQQLGKGAAVGRLLDLWALRKNGERFAMELSLSSFQLSGAWHAIGIIRDTTEKKAVETALRKSEAKYRELVQTTHTAILRCTCEGRVVFFNEYAQTFFGYPESEIVGRAISETLVPEIVDSQNMDAAIRRLLDERLPSLSAETRNRRRDGQEVWMAWTFKPVDGHILCSGTDITYIKQSEAIIRQQQAQMAMNARLASLGTMAAGIAHEINSPLASISIATEHLESLVSGHANDAAQMRMVAQTVLRNVQRIASIVRGLRSMTRDGGTDPFVRVAVKDILSDVGELCRMRFNVHNVLLVLPEVPGALEIECRSSQIAQALLNLVNNAFDAVETQEDKWVMVAVEDQGEHVEFSVTDSGRGIDQKIQNQMTDPFFTTKPPDKGVGLGLNIAQSMVAAHGGELTLDRASPHTRFWFSIPKRRQIASSSNPGA